MSVIIFNFYFNYVSRNGWTSGWIMRFLIAEDLYLLSPTEDLSLYIIGQLATQLPRSSHWIRSFLVPWMVNRSAKPTTRIFRRISSTNSASATISHLRRSPELSLAARTTLSSAPSASTLSRSLAPPSPPLASKTSSGKRRSLLLSLSSAAGRWFFFFFFL